MFFFFDYTPYIAIIGDMIGSKQIDHRNSVQKQLDAVLRTVNQDFKADIASNFMITLGDEFQGLLKAGASAIFLIDRIEREMFPVKLRFGLGVGEMTTAIDPDLPLGSDGPAYYFAREMIDELKVSQKKKMEPGKSISIKIQNNPRLSALLNTVFSLLFAIKETWTPRQAEIMNVHVQNGGTQAETAKILGIFQPNVQQALAATNFYTYRDALKTISGLLSEIKEDAHG